MKKAKKQIDKKPARPIKVKKKPGKLGSLVHETHLRLHKFKLWQRIFIYIIVGVVTLLTLNAIVERLVPEVKNPDYGVSFSEKYARELGVDWKANFTALLDDMQIKNFRLMSYWDDVEPTQGKFDFKDLDWQMNEAAKRGAKVSLAIGMRQPRWPECHKPTWLVTLDKAQQDQALFDFNKAVINHYKDFPALQSYQMENESRNTWFGVCTTADIDQPRLVREFDAAKAEDPKHPIYMSLSDQTGLPISTPVPDKYGFSVYRVVWNNKTGPFKFYITYPATAWFHRARAWWIHTFKHRETFVHELQMEPWGPVATVNMTVDEQNRSMSPEQIHKNFVFGRKAGMKDIYTWGGEWWYWRKTKFNDPSIWDAAKSELNRN